MIWREKRTLLIVLGAILLANAIFFFTYRVQYENRLRALDTRLDQVTADLEQARGARLAAERQVAEYRKIQQDVDDIIQNRWSTQSERLTALIGEVKKMTEASRLTPPTFSFTRTEARKASATDKTPGAVQVGVAFTVRGSYQQIRQLINRIELSNQFVIISQMGLSSDSGEQLSMTIQLKTLFRDTSAVRQPANQDL
ncbi:MAG TPA: hypothetical protein VMS98_15650 [Thermoanaerobaculia bacterium]|nr:hypothetical protein [Thermoanaerobaculia bacterium]